MDRGRAEAHEVPPGLPRLAWRAGGVWMVARQALMPRRAAKAMLFAAAAAVAAWAAWPAPEVGHAAVSRFHVIATVLLLAGLPLLARRFLGPASPSRAGRALRVFCGIQGCDGVPGRSTGGPPWAGEIVLLLLTIGYLGVVLYLTSRRSLISRSTLAIGTGTGLLLGVVMYGVAPLGLNNYATNPWAAGLRGRPAGGADLDLAVRRAGRGRLAGQPTPPPDGGRPAARQSQDRSGHRRRGAGHRDRRSFVTALGTSTVALLLESAGLRHWLSHGQPTAISTYRTDIYAGANVFGYILIWISFPVIRLIASATVASVFADSAPPEPRRTC